MAAAGVRALPAPLWVVVLAALASNALIFAPAILVGLWLGPQVGLGAPEIEAWTVGRVPSVQRLAPALSIGLGVAAAVVALDLWVFAPRLPALPQAPTPSPLAGLLASLYGGIAEETLMRLGVMTVAVWALAKLARGTRPWIYWFAIVLAAALFGLGHLPATSAVLPLTALVVARAIVLNGVAGVAFGWLYWRRGLLAAMLSHFSADLGLHVLVPLLR